MTAPEPTATYLEDVYRFAWPDGVEAVLERFYEQKSPPDIGCELSVRSDTHAELLTGSRLYLTGTGTRRDNRKALEERDPNIDWDARLNQICDMAKLRYRRGSPVIRLAEHQPGERPKWGIYPLMLGSGPTVLFGPEGTSKSIIALAAAASIASGTNILWQQPELQGPVLYLDWEDDADAHHERLEALCAGVGIAPPLDLHYQRQTASLHEAAREIRRTLADIGAVALFVDSIGRASTDPDSPEAIIRCFNGIASFNLPCLCTHHIGKDAKDKTRPYGTVFAPAAARMTWGIEKTQEEGDESITVALTNHKTNRGKKEPRRGYRIDFTNTYDGSHDILTHIQFTHVDPRSVPQLNTTGSELRWQILSALVEAGEPLDHREIEDLLKAEGVEFKSGTVNRILRRYRDKMFTTVEGKWAALSGREEVLP